MTRQFSFLMFIVQMFHKIISW